MDLHHKIIRMHCMYVQPSEFAITLSWTWMSYIDMTIFKVPHAWLIEPLDVCTTRCRMQSVSCPNRWTLLYVSCTSPAFSCPYENCRHPENPVSSLFISLTKIRGNQWSELSDSDMNYNVTSLNGLMWLILTVDCFTLLL